MKLTNKYTRKCKQAASMAAAALLILSATSCRRDLWVYQDNYKQVELDIDWRSYFREWPLNPNVQPALDPDGMTVWFFPKDGRTSFQYTTAEVRHYETYLSKGDYDAVVIDYSPAEYGHQEFVGMDFANTAKVQALPNSYQPDSIPELFGAAAYAVPLPRLNANGLYEVAWEPEDIASDTAQMTVNTGEYDRFIPYKDRDKYQSTLVKQLYNMKPVIIPWNMRIRIYIKGIYYLYQAQASVAGLADGYYLVNCKSSDKPCLLNIPDWEIHVTGENEGYIAKTFKTWGPMNFENRNWDFEVAQRPLEGRIFEGGVPLNHFSYEQLYQRDPNEIRINLKLLLRDRETIKYYHFNAGNLVHVFRNEYALRIDLMDGIEGQPNLPYVEAYRGINMDGVVIPWEEKEQVDVEF